MFRIYGFVIGLKCKRVTRTGTATIAWNMSYRHYRHTQRKLLPNDLQRQLLSLSFRASIFLSRLL